MQRPVVVRVGDSKPFIETPMCRQEWLPVSQMPLTVNGRGIALLLEHLAQHCFPGVDARVARVVERPCHSNAIGIATSQKGGTGRGANRLRHVETGEACPLARQL